METNQVAGLWGKLFSTHKKRLETIKLAFFDMDHTLIDNDCDLSWKEYLVATGRAGWLDRLKGRWHYRMYRWGRLNQKRFTRFQLAQFRGRTPAELEPLLAEHFELYVKPRIYPAVLILLEELRQAGIPRYLVTATNHEIARPLAEFLALDGVLATELELDPAGRYSGEIAGVYALGAEKLKLMEPVARSHGTSLAAACYWGDSQSDLEVLAAVGHPVAANPVPELERRARESGWPIVKFDEI